jgi:DNA-binding GntR family transcriptional regulator
VVPPSPVLRPLDRQSTAGVIADSIRERIMDGAFAPGAQLTEALLADQLDVSRGPVREAFQRLVQEGLLTSVPHRGVFVTTIEPDEVADVYLARAVVEREAARLVARADDRRVIARLRGFVDEMAAAAVDGSWGDIAETDLRFHATLVAEAGSPRLDRMYRTLLAETRLCLRGLRHVHPDPAEVVAEHRALVDAIAEGDAAQAVRCVEQHLTRAVDGTGYPGPRPDGPARGTSGKS